MQVFFHVTPNSAAAAIMASGFLDGEAGYMGTSKGVWLSDHPLDADETSCSTLRVSFPPDTDLSSYEWVEGGKEYREWLIPAVIINSTASVVVVDDENR